MSLVDNIQKIALLSVIEPDAEAQIRKICRYVSRNFNIPLPQVEELPLDYVLIHYFEDVYAEMSEEDRLQQIQLLLETPEERQAREAKEAADDDAFLKEAEEEAAQQSKEDKIKALKKATQKGRLKKGPLKDGETDVAVDPDLVQPNTTLPVEKPRDEVEGEVKINYIDKDLLEELAQGDFVPSKK